MKIGQCGAPCFIPSVSPAGRRKLLGFNAVSPPFVDPREINRHNGAMVFPSSADTMAELMLGYIEGPKSAPAIESADDR